MCQDYTAGAEATLTAGTYIVFVDDVLAGISGPYTLVVREAVTPTAVTGNDACSAAHAITADGSWSGANSSLTNQGDGSCATATGGLEAWFTFTLTASTDVHVDTFGSDYDTVLFIREGSCTGTEAGCNLNAGFRTESALDLTLAAGTYYLAVDGAVSTATGNYQLNVMGL
ncbi:MAG: pre-peptidase C-terminal domain-containing protein [Deltaproteobacteria bacterium]|nr:pre-peptidase C-terminal domain-containing protein [Deltaproteobacteria bacterium]